MNTLSVSVRVDRHVHGARAEAVCKTAMHMSARRTGVRVDARADGPALSEETLVRMSTHRAGMSVDARAREVVSRVAAEPVCETVLPSGERRMGPRVSADAAGAALRAQAQAVCETVVHVETTSNRRCPV